VNRKDMKSRGRRAIAALALCGMSVLACGQVADVSSSRANGSAGFDASAAGNASTNNGGSSDGSAGALPSNERVSDLIEDYDTLELHFDDWKGPCGDGVSGDLYRVTRSPASIAWSGCAFGSNQQEPTAATRLLSAASIESITGALAKVRPSEPGCGEDYPMLTLDVTYRSKIDLYADGLSVACDAEPIVGRSSVTGLLELHDVISKLAK
jgi:hypothetical protein